MAISRGAGTEIIRSALFKDIDNGGSFLIFGEQHHIYTVLSIIIYCESAAAVGNLIHFFVSGYDSENGTTAQTVKLLQHKLVTGETFVWNDRFSFNGHEPTDFAGPLDNLTKQDAIADQGSSVAQKLYCFTTGSADQVEVIVSYIDQNNA